MKLFLVLCTLALAVNFAWAVGEGHRNRCINAGRVACSAWPWNDGRPKPKPLTPAEQAVQCDENSADVGRCELNEILRK